MLLGTKHFDFLLPNLGMRDVDVLLKVLRGRQLSEERREKLITWGSWKLKCVLQI